MDGVSVEHSRVQLDRYPIPCWGFRPLPLNFCHGTGLIPLTQYSERLLDFFLELNNRVINRFSAVERAHIGVHTCPGGDCDSTHSLDVPYELLLKEMFRLVCLSFSSSSYEWVFDSLSGLIERGILFNSMRFGERPQ